MTGRIVDGAVVENTEIAEVLRKVGPEGAAGADLLEFSRQSIASRDPLPLEVAANDEPGTIALLKGFVVPAGTADEHLCALWASADVLDKQFSIVLAYRPNDRLRRRVSRLSR